jgi:DDE superfamily endonuclease
VITHLNTKAVYLSDPDNREMVTSVECISGGGFVIASMIILAGSVLIEKHFDNSIDDDVLFDSETGYTNAKLSMEWLRHFDKQTASRQKGKYRMLVFDGHRSYLTDEFTYYCWEHDIIPFRLPAHSTHLLQPLDIGVFQPFKH